MKKSDNVNYKQYLVYQITNKLDNKIYIGVHVTDNIDDNYMGSGTNISKAIKEIGRENFDKIILYNFDNSEDMFEKEEQLVNREFIKREDTYNIIIGGGKFLTTDTITVKDANGNCFRVHREDPRYLSGELISHRKNKISVKDSNGNNLQVDCDDPRYLSGELVSNMKNKVHLKDKNGLSKFVDKDDPRYLSGDLVGCTKGMILVKDLNNNYYKINKEDPRYLSGELKFSWNGKKHTKETKKKIGEKNSIKQKGKGNSQYGTCWIYNLELKESKKIKKEDLNKYLKSSWILGRKMKF